ncbi:MAG: hypothetical protein ACXVB9_19350 [Bdellovibrionota bacterium]
MKRPHLLLLSLGITTQAFACPMINGVFTLRDPGGTRTVQLSTQIVQSGIQYRLGAGTGFVTADGLAHDASLDGTRSGKVKVSCDATTVTIQGQENGASAMTIKITQLGDKQIRVESDSPATSGIYTRD